MSCPVAIGTGRMAGNISIENRTRHAAIMLRLIALEQAILVDSNLEMPQKRRGVLNFVDDQALSNSSGAVRAASAFAGRSRVR